MFMDILNIGEMGMGSSILRSVKASSQIQRTQDGAQLLQKKAAISEIA